MQMHKSTISKKINLLSVVVDPSLYTHYSADKAYPSTNYPFPNDVDEVPDFTACNNNNKTRNCQKSALISPQNVQHIVNMNAVLINTLLSLIPMAFKLLYKQEWMMDPNADFRQCFHWFC